jgi:hypothetical protein
MPSTRQPRKTFSVSDSLNRKLNTYTQVAAAAGASVLALAGVSDAEVIYTKTNQVTHAGAPLYIDLNHDGINDFLLRTNLYRGSSGTEIGLSVLGDRNADNVVAGKRFSTSGGYFFSAAFALPAGTRIGPKLDFSVDLPIMAVEHFERVGNQYSDLGEWAGKKDEGVKNRYLGLKFVIDGEVHYGWARFSVTLEHLRQFGDVSGTLTGYAYETVPDKPIIAGQTTGPDVITVPSEEEQEPGASVEQPGSAYFAQPARNAATLGMLARGSSALALWRQKQSAPEGK